MRYVLPASDGRMAAGLRKKRRGKSGLHGNTVTDNIRRGQPQGKRHRNDTAYRPKAAARLKWCGKSAPRPWQQGWHGKPHREQDQIGTARNPFPDSRPGRSREAAGNCRSRGMAIYRGQPRGQNPAYRPSDVQLNHVMARQRQRDPATQSWGEIPQPIQSCSNCGYLFRKHEIDGSSRWPISQAPNSGKPMQSCPHRRGNSRIKISHC